ncbi:MAG TPA: DUF3276 family protein [Bacteroidota bacterium]|nr:DUF3276 family protein [Bacteroidota bacterium]
MEGLYSKIIKAGDRTYFVDVREAKNKSRYLAISETRPPKDGGKKFERSKVILFEAQVAEFRSALEEAAGILAG